MKQDVIEAIKQDTYPPFLPQYACIPRNMKRPPDILGEVTAVDYTSDKDHSSVCFYVNLNPEGSEWIDAIRKRIDMYERQKRLTFNSCYGMYVEERPKFDLKQYLKQYLYFKNGDEMKMTASARQIEIEYDEKKKQLLREQEERKWQAKKEYEQTLDTIDHEYEELFLNMDKEKEAAKNKEKADTHAKAVKDTYESYIAQGFTKTQAESFVKIMLENLKT